MKNNDYVVYLHKTKEGLVFYVGHGKIARAYKLERSRRSGEGTYRGKSYSNFVESINYQYDVEIFKDSLSKEDAIKLEIELYDKYKQQLVNHNKPCEERIMSLDMFEKFLYYDPSSKSGLRWKVNTGKARSDSEAGCLRSSDNYYQVRVQGKVFLAHRIILVLFGQKVQGKVVDHIDGNPTNNSVENLRVVSQKENMNRRMVKPSGKSGRVGVSLVENGKRFNAVWVEDCKIRIKSFSVGKYGYDLARRLASNYRQLKEIEHGITVNRTSKTKLKIKGTNMLNNKLTLAIAKLVQSSQLFNEMAGKDSNFSKDAIYNQIRLINEEVLEMNTAFSNNDSVELLDAVLDIMVVLTGLAQQLVAAGVDFDAAANMVAENNLSKFTKNVDVANKTVKELTKNGVICRVEFNEKHGMYLVKNSQEKICKPITFESVNLKECVPANLIIHGFTKEQ